MHYVVVGLSHKTAPVEIREKLALLSAPKRVECLERLVGQPDVQESMWVSTCNRVEVYLVAKHAERGSGAARELLATIGGFRQAELENHLYVKEEAEAIGHLFRVTASLDSMLVGEPQISGQVKEAYSEAVVRGTTGTYLNRLVHRSLQVAKRVRSETSIGRYPVSLSYSAVVLATKIFGKLKEKTVLVIGAGEMGALAGRHFRERKVGHILIANRSQEKAQQLAVELGGEALTLEEVEGRLAECDIVLSSIESAELFLTSDLVRRAMARRKGRSMFLVDLGVPRNIAADVNEIENVYLYNIDDLQGIVEANKKEREREAKRAEGIVQEEIGRFLGNLREIDLAPTIRELSKKFDLIRHRELDRFLSRHPQLTPEEREALEAMTAGIVGKILHEPIILMKTEEAKDGQPKYSEILKKLFKLDVIS